MSWVSMLRNVPLFAGLTDKAYLDRWAFDRSLEPRHLCSEFMPWLV
jgi:hypothetical protein